MYYYLKNIQGDIVKIVNKEGKEYVKYEYDAWGKIINQSGETILRDLNPLRYRGYVYDRETGLYYLQSRYYDPVTGRFLNADDTAYIGATGTVLSTNLFSYCENNHIIYADYSGNQREKMSYSWDIRKVSSSYKVYVIYYAYGKNNFKTQAYNCYNYDAKSKNTTIKELVQKMILLELGIICLKG